MFRDKYILDNELIKPDEQLLASLTSNMKSYVLTKESPYETVSSEHGVHAPHNQRRFLFRYGSIAACFALLLFMSTVFYKLNLTNQKSETMATEDVATMQFSAEVETEAMSKDTSASLKQDSSTEDKEVTNLEEHSLNSFENGIVNIATHTVDSIQITSLLATDTYDQIINDKDIITDIVIYFNSLTIIETTMKPEDNSEPNRIAIIRYKKSGSDTIIQLMSHFIKINDGDWYQLSENDIYELDTILSNNKTP